MIFSFPRKMPTYFTVVVFIGLTFSSTHAEADAQANEIGQMLTSFQSSDDQQLELMFQEIHHRVHREEHAQPLDRSVACEALADFVVNAQDAKRRALGLRYWHGVSAEKIDLPESLVAVIFDRMLSDISNIGTEKMQLSPQDVATDVLAFHSGKEEARLLKWLESDGREERLGAARVFVKSEQISSEATNRLIGRLTTEPDSGVASEIAAAFARFEYRCDDAAGLLLANLNGSCNDRGMAAYSLGALATRISRERCSEAARALTDEWNRKSDLPGYRALVSLRALIIRIPDEEQKRLVAALIAAAGDSKNSQRLELSLIAAAGKNGAAAIPLLNELIDKSEADDRPRLAGYLWAVEGKTDKVLKIFTAAIHSEDSVERHYGLEGLVEMQAAASSAVPEVLRLLSAKKAGTRVSALRCLRDFGEIAHQALPELEDYLSSASDDPARVDFITPRERQALIEAIAAIRPAK